MDACNIDEIQNLFIYYSACFSKYFPELGFYCNEREFQIHGIVRRYSDITGVSHDGSYFLIEMRKRNTWSTYRYWSVPNFRILTKQKATLFVIQSYAYARTHIHRRSRPYYRFPVRGDWRLGKIPKDNLFPYENRYTYGRSWEPTWFSLPISNI